MKVFVVIVTFNGAAWIRGALQSLRDSIHDCTAVVVDNASTDDSTDIVRREFSEAVLIQTGANLGFGVGNNRGIEYALRHGADAVFLLNQDAYVTPQAIGQMVNFLGMQPNFDIVSPLHCSPDLGHVDPATQRFYLQRYASGFLSDACIGRVQSHYEVRGINAAAWMLRAGVFSRVGGFDPLFFMYAEDDDLIERFAHLGVRTALLPGARIVHLRAKAPRPKRSWTGQVAALAERERSSLILLLKIPGGRIFGHLLRLIAAGVVQPFAKLLMDHDLQAFLARMIASVKVLTEFPRIRRHADLCSRPGTHFLDIEAKHECAERR